MAIATRDEYLLTIPDEDNRARMAQVLSWVDDNYPQLKFRIAWNQPMFTDHGTFIIGFSAAKKHMAMTPEQHTLEHFAEELEKRGVDRGAMLVRQPWDKPFDYELAAMFIDYQIATKQEMTTFWRP